MVSQQDSYVLISFLCYMKQDAGTSHPQGKWIMYLAWWKFLVLKFYFNNLTLQWGKEHTW